MYIVTKSLHYGVMKSCSSTPNGQNNDHRWQLSKDATTKLSQVWSRSVNRNFRNGIIELKCISSQQRAQRQWWGNIAQTHEHLMLSFSIQSDSASHFEWRAGSKKSVKQCYQTFSLHIQPIITIILKWIVYAKVLTD